MDGGKIDTHLARTQSSSSDPSGQLRCCRRLEGSLSVWLALIRDSHSDHGRKKRPTAFKGSSAAPGGQHEKHLIGCAPRRSLARTRRADCYWGYFVVASDAARGRLALNCGSALLSNQLRP
jgi:hypothetical protein